MFSLTSFQQQYQTDTAEVVVNARRFRLLVPQSLENYIDPINPLEKFPLWPKIWHASLVLADFIARKPVNSAKKFLEIGAGIGLVSIVAACRGHNITLTEYDRHALNFARANALINKCPGLVIRKLDWCKPDLNEVFDFIVGSEVIYKEESLQPLLRLFKKLLKPEGEVILVGEIRKHDRAFYQTMEPLFNLTIQRKVLRAADQKTHIYLTNMRFK